MRLAAFTIALFGFAFAVHWLIWRIRIPRRQTLALLLIFLGSLLLGLWVLALMPELHAPVRSGPAAFLQVSQFHVAMALVYIVVYTALEEQSPTLSLVKFVAEARESGRSWAELVAHLEAIQTLQSRLEAMLRDGLLSEEDGVYRLTGKGRSWARVFRWWRGALNMNVGG
jgi:hypothetical protein